VPLLVDDIIARLCAALYLDNAATISHSARFTELGIDSRRALELKEELEADLGCTLQTTLLFDYPTPERLATFIVDTVLGPREHRHDAPVESAGGVEPKPAQEGDADFDALMRRTFEKYGL
jgi:acyl carrier protein